MPGIVVTGEAGNVVVGNVWFCKVTVPGDVLKLARFTTNFKSSIWDAVHVDAFWDLNNTPA